MWPVHTQEKEKLTLTLYGLPMTKNIVANLNALHQTTSKPNFCLLTNSCVMPLNHHSRCE